MRERWLIIADDLTGAADTAIAFVGAGWQASVGWGDAVPDAAVLALDADTRAMAPQEAAARQMALLAGHLPGRAALFKKIDSTLRGNPAAELAAMLRALPGRTVAVVAPAFPATGRTTEGGCVFLHGAPLEDTPLWVREHAYPTADLRRVFACAELTVRHADLAAVRAGAPADALSGADVLVCDAVTDDDLTAIAGLRASAGTRLLWVGAAGLARALADGGKAPVALPRVEGGILIVVGSLAEPSRDGAALLAQRDDLVSLPISPDMLRAGAADPTWRATAERAMRAMTAPRDLLVSVAAVPGATPTALSAPLAALLAPAARQAGAIIATGGETARALCAACGITSIRLLAELEPGVPLGLAQGAVGLPIVTKAGAFGDAGTLGRCLARLRASRELP